MNTVVTSQEALLLVSKNLIREKGWGAVNIRAVAAAGGVSIGTVYNYFACKSELLAKTIESIWRDIFHAPRPKDTEQNFLLCLDWIFNSLKNGNDKYPNFFASHAIQFLDTEKSHGQVLMQRAWQHMKSGLLAVLEADVQVHSDAFSDIFTKEQFVDTVFSFILAALPQRPYDCAAVKEIIRRVIY